MSIPCIVEIDGVAYKIREPYQFATLPRIGETISLEWDEEKKNYQSFYVYGVLHVPDEVQELPAFTVLRVRRAT